MNYSVNINGIDVNAKYSDNSIEHVLLPILKRASSLCKEQNRRIIVYVAAPPGAGKSTLCSFLQKLSEDNKDVEEVQAIGMDGFHRRQEFLESHYTHRDGKEIKMVEIKGAPETFDLDKLSGKIDELKENNIVKWPVYDRLLHNPVEDAIIVDKQIVFLEGNYLLLKEDGWKELKEKADLTVFISADANMLRNRLIDRKIKSGNSQKKAEAFVDYSDMVNVDICLNSSSKADIVLNLGVDDEYRFDKSTIRKMILAKRDELSDSERIHYSRRIFDKVINTSMYENADNILIYASMGSEVITDDIINHALSNGKNVFCPKCTDTKNGIMEFVKITNLSDLKKGYYGIREPLLSDASVLYGASVLANDTNQESENTTCSENAESALMIMPLVAFDADNNRIGYSGGYYDRYLCRFPNIPRIGIAFEVQRVADAIPVETHDVKAEHIITEC